MNKRNYEKCREFVIENERNKERSKFQEDKLKMYKDLNLKALQKDKINNE